MKQVVANVFLGKSVQEKYRFGHVAKMSWEGFAETGVPVITSHVNKSSKIWRRGGWQVADLLALIILQY